MPVIERPKDRGPLFGGRTEIFIGGPLVHQLREWKKRKEASSTPENDAENLDGTCRVRADATGLE